MEGIKEKIHKELKKYDYVDNSDGIRNQGADFEKIVSEYSEKFGLEESDVREIVYDFLEENYFKYFDKDEYSGNCEAIYFQEKEDLEDYTKEKKEIEEEYEETKKGWREEE